MSITPSALLFTSIFPERDRSCFFSKLDVSDDDFTRYKSPLGYHQGEPLPYLMALKEYLDGGYETNESKILVCIKSIGPRKKCMCEELIIAPRDDKVIDFIQLRTKAASRLLKSRSASLTTQPK